MTQLFYCRTKDDQDAYRAEQAINDLIAAALRLRNANVRAVHAMQTGAMTNARTFLDESREAVYDVCEAVSRWERAAKQEVTR